MANLNIGTWERPAEAGPPREFMVSAELYVSTTAGAALRKVCGRTRSSVSLTN